MKYVFILLLLVVGAAAGAWGSAIVVRWNDNMTHTARIMPGERVFSMPPGVVPRGGDLIIPKEQRDVANKQPNPVKALKADYGRLLLIAKRPRDAQEVLDQAVRETPDFSDAWTNLAWARFQNGDPAAACVAAEEAAKKRPSNNSISDLTAVRTVAKCK